MSNVEWGIYSLCDHLTDPITGHAVSQGERLRSVAHQASLAEQAGFDSFGVGEHHFSEYILPAPLILLAYAAAATSTIRLGTSVTLLANHDPVRVAEELALLDVLTDGRAEATFARGVSLATAQAFGFPDFDQVRPRFEEHLRLVLRLLSEDEVTWSGEHRGSLSQVRLQPRPIQPPADAIWVGGGLSQISADLAAELGLPLLLPSLFRWPVDYLDIVLRYRDRSAAASNIAKVGFPTYLHVARTSQEARARFMPRFEHYISFAKSTRIGFGRSLDFESLLKGPVVCGSPAEVAERIAEINDILDLDRQMFLIDAGGVPDDVVADVIDLMGSSVLPLVR
jgi:alkanesulfonate monooxygenase SsuD/methylene tetrahydromethanopterin reductase-like flavin-dependent oxidoreductase (luciferase family)